MVESQIRSMYTSRITLFKVLIISTLISFTSCSEGEESGSTSGRSPLAKVERLILSAEGISYEVDLTPLRQTALAVTLTTKTGIPSDIEEVTIEDFEISENASSTLQIGQIRQISPDVNIEFSIRAESGLEVDYTIDIEFDFPDFTVENFDVETTPVDPSINFKTIMDFRPSFSTPEITGDCFKSTVWGTYGYDGWGFWDSQNDFDPRQMDANGRRDIQHLLYPSVDVYDVNDPLYQEYTSIILKTSGVDIVCYNLDLRSVLGGRMSDNCDFSVYSADAYFNSFEKAGLSFIARISGNAAFSQFGLDPFTEEQANAAFEEMMSYLEQNVFSKPNYYRQDGLPLVYMRSGVEDYYDTYNLFSGRVHLVTEDSKLYEALSFSEKSLQGDLNNSASFAWITSGAGAAEEVTDVSQIRYGDGMYLQNSLDFARSNFDFIYLSSWNDYETRFGLRLFEPTLEFGYSQLEVLSAFLGPSYSADAFKVCTDYYIKRKAFQNNGFVQLQLDQIREYMLSNQVEKAIELNEMITGS